MDQTNAQHGRASQNAIPVGGFRQGNGPTVERGVLNGDDIHFGRMRRRTRSSQSGSQGSGAEEEWLGSPMEGAGSYGQSPILRGMQAEHNWHSRSAEGNYQRRFAGNGSPSSSPRSPNTRGSFTSRSLTFRSKGPYGQQQDQEYPSHPITTVRSSGTPHRQPSRGRSRTSSETGQGGKGSRGPTHRKRGLSETESWPRWDKYDISLTQGMGET
uniref:uncharacterized protein n=1 Tax=Centroberyx gerrardi TaxID=166262 RepID=UPI003AADD14D